MARGLLSVLPIAISALLFLAATLVIKALIDDVFDLIAEDRRLRMLALVIALLPVIVLVGGQFYFQSSVIGFNGEQVQGINSVADLNRFIVDTNLSRYLIWQPGGWIARAAAAAAQGAYGSWLLWTGALLAFVLVGYAVHYGLLRRLFFGELVRVRARQRASDERVRAAGPRLPLVAAQTSQAFWGLLRADWAGFIRNPYTIRMAIAPVILGMMAVVFGSTMPGPPAFFAALIGAMAVLVLTMSYAHNIFGILDSPGLGSVLMAPVHLRLLLLSHNLLLTAAVVALAIGVGLLVGLINRDWQGLLALVGAALLVQFPMLSVCNLTSVYMPYKIDLEKGRAAANESRTSFIAVFGVMAGAFVLTAPTVILVLVPWQLLGWPLLPGVVAAALYEAVVYALTFWWAGRALEQRGPQIMAEISQSP
jgi:hypothetical protein